MAYSLYCDDDCVYQLDDCGSYGTVVCNHRLIAKELETSAAERDMAW